MDTTPDFDGESFAKCRDGRRLALQLAIVRTIMSDGEPHTLAELAEAAGASVASVSARVRDLKKQKFGGRLIERKWLGNGIWSYRLLPIPAEAV